MACRPDDHNSFAGLFVLFLLYITFPLVSTGMKSLGTRGGQSLTNLVVSDNRPGNGDDSGSSEGGSRHSFCGSSDRHGNGPTSAEQRIKRMLLCGYDPTSRPVYNESTTTRVNIAISLFHILDTDEKHQTFTILVSVRLKWIDEFLRWDESEYDNTSTIHIKYSLIWTPDIVISNSADDSLRSRPETYTIVGSDGSVLWMYPSVVKVTCSLQVKHFPFDHQSCDLKFISWTYNGNQVDVYHNATLDSNKIYYNQENQEWSVAGITTLRTEKIYACCPEPYPDVTVSIHLDRHSLFYIFNLIFPCILIYLTSFLAFFLPVESGEKVNLELTILLALIVFLLVIGETLPPTPDSIPLLGILFAITMLMVLAALFMGVIVTNVHFRKYNPDRLPRIIEAYIRTFHCQRHRNAARSARDDFGARSGRESSTYSPVNRCFNSRFIHSVLSDELRHAQESQFANASPSLVRNELLRRSNGFMRNTGGGGGETLPSVDTAIEDDVKPQVMGPPSTSVLPPKLACSRDSHLSLFETFDAPTEGVALALTDLGGSNVSPAGSASSPPPPPPPPHPHVHSHPLPSAPPGPLSSLPSVSQERPHKTKKKSGGSKEAKQKKEEPCICQDPESWVIVARTIDRFFFWSFTLISVCVVALMVNSVPRQRKHPLSDVEK